MGYRNLIAAVMLALTFTGAHAGSTSPVPVFVDLDGQVAFGDMVTARYSTNKLEFIGCGARSFDLGGGGLFVFGFCQAQDAEGNSANCFTENPDLIDQIKSISAYSFITFSWDLDEGGDMICTGIGNSTQSFYLPRGLTSNKPTGGDL